MISIRFLRLGKKNHPFYRIVATDKKNPPQGGRFLEVLGFYNPLTKEKKLKSERIKYWLSVGAKASDTVYNLLVSEKIVQGKKIRADKPVKKKKQEESMKKEQRTKEADTKEEKQEKFIENEKSEESAEKQTEKLEDKKI